MAEGDGSGPGSAAFAELGARSNFSLLDGASHPEELVGTAAALGLAGLSVCDTNSLAGAAHSGGDARRPTPPDTAPEQPKQRGLDEADDVDLVQALAYALRFDARGKPRKGGWDHAADLAAEWLAEHLERSHFVVLKRPPGAPHRAG